MSLAGRRALVTGGGTGLGASLARGLAAAGAEVIVCGRRPDPLDALAAATPGVRAITADITDEAQVAALYSDAGRVDIVVANAGTARSAPLHRTSLELWHEMIGANLTGAFLTLRDGYAQLRGAEWGRLITIASTAGLRGYAYVSAYTAAKHGAVGLTRAIAAEVQGSGITANALCPGYLDTEMTDRTLDNIVATTGRTREQAIDALAADNPQGRLIDPDEVTRVALALCMPGREHVNGAAIEIDGSEW
ncbi:MAG: SDR family NAD(P)-dependent oxidoreductase [Ilumatobacteraceae bacterium]